MEREIRIDIPENKNDANNRKQQQNQITIVKDNIVTANIKYHPDKTIVTIVNSPYVKVTFLDSSSYEIANGESWYQVIFPNELKNKRIKLKCSFDETKPKFPKNSCFHVDKLKDIYSENFNKEECSIMKYDLKSGITKYPLYLSKAKKLKDILNGCELVKLSANRQSIDSVVIGEENIKNYMISEEFAIMQTNKKEDNAATVYGQYVSNGQSLPFLYYLDPKLIVSNFISKVICLIAGINTSQDKKYETSHNREFEVEISDIEFRVRYVLYPFDEKTQMSVYIKCVGDPCRITLTRR